MDLRHIWQITTTDIANLKDSGCEDFENRLKAQKCGYPAKYFGLDLGYVCSIHLHGSHLRALATDYYNLDVATVASASVPTALKKDEFLSALKGRDADWMEIAATIIREKKLDKSILLKHLYVMKCDRTPKFIDSVYRDLTDISLLYTNILCI